MSAPLRVAHFLINLEIGGAEVMVLNMCRWLQQNGHQPQMHALFGSGPLEAQFQESAIPVVRYPKTNRLGLMRAIHRRLQSDPVDIVHLHNVSPTVHAALPARTAGVRCVVATRHSLVAPPYNWKSELQFSLAARCLNTVVGVCEATAANLRRAPLAPQGPGRIIAIANGAFAARAAGETIATHNRFTLVHVARLSPPKDQANLMRAVALASRRIPHLQLWMVGDGNLLAPLQSLNQELGIQERVVFWGAKANVADYLAAADTAIFSSISEGLPIALLEAMAAGLPVVTTDVGGLSEVVRESGCGMLVPPSNPEALASAIVGMAELPAERRREFGEKALAAYRLRYTNDRMNESYLDLYRKCLNGEKVA